MDTRLSEQDALIDAEITKLSNQFVYDLAQLVDAMSTAVQVRVMAEVVEYVKHEHEYVVDREAHRAAESRYTESLSLVASDMNALIEKHLAGIPGITPTELRKVMQASLEFALDHNEFTEDEPHTIYE